MDFSRLRASTIPGLLVERARARPARVAFRAKELGVYRETTWAALAARVAAVAQGLAARFGVGRGSTVAILGDPCPEWTIADLAAQALGAVTYGIYPTSAPGEVRYLLEHGGARVVIVEDQEHLDKTLAVLDDAPGVRGGIVVDTRALFLYPSTRVHPVADLEAPGRAPAPVDAPPRQPAPRPAATAAPPPTGGRGGGGRGRGAGGGGGGGGGAAGGGGRGGGGGGGAFRAPPMRVLARGLVFRWLLEKVGFARVRLLISSGAPLPPAVATLWQVGGVNPAGAYGQTETGGALASGPRGPRPRPRDVGAPAPTL